VCLTVDRATGIRESNQNGPRVRFWRAHKASWRVSITEEMRRSSQCGGGRGNPAIRRFEQRGHLRHERVDRHARLRRQVAVGRPDAVDFRGLHLRAVAVRGRTVRARRMPRRGNRPDGRSAVNRYRTGSWRGSWLRSCGSSGRPLRWPGGSSARSTGRDAPSVPRDHLPYSVHPSPRPTAEVSRTGAVDPEPPGDNVCFPGDKLIKTRRPVCPRSTHRRTYSHTYTTGCVADHRRPDSHIAPAHGSCRVARPPGCSSGLRPPSGLPSP